MSENPRIRYYFNLPVPLFIHRYRLFYIHRYHYLLTGTVSFYIYRCHYLFTGTIFYFHRYHFLFTGTALIFIHPDPVLFLFTGPVLIIGSILFTGPAFSGSGLTGYTGPVVLYTTVPTQSEFTGPIY